MPGKKVPMPTAIEIAKLLFEGQGYDKIKAAGVTKSDPQIRTIKSKIEKGEIVRDEHGNVAFLDLDLIKTEDPGPIGNMRSTPGVDSLEKQTTRKLVEEETRYTKDAAVEMLKRVMQIGRYAQDNFQSKARWRNVSIQTYLYQASRFYEQYDGVLELAEQEGSLMEEGMLNASWRIDSLERELEQKEYLMGYLRLQLEKSK